ncbi:thiamine phosphate synthase [Spirosoma humi]
MSRNPFLLIGITDGSTQSQDGQQLAALLANGLDYIYWRTPADPADAMRLPPAVQKALLVSAPAADDVHQPFKWHLKESDRGRLSGRSQSFSTSIHQLSDWPTLAGQAELVFYSPVFASISKPGYGPTVSLDTIKSEIDSIRQQSVQLPRLIGLGGVQANTIQLVRQAGFDGAALMGALWQASDPVDALIKIRTNLRAEAP